MSEYLPYIFFSIKGVITTLEYSVISIILALLIGIIDTIYYRNTVFKAFINGYVSIFYNTPLFMQFGIIYCSLLWIVENKLCLFISGIITFSLNSGAFIIVIIRNNIDAIDRKFVEAATALSIPKNLIMKDIILPQASKNIVPLVINEFTNLIKNSAIISMFSEIDWIHKIELIEGKNYLTPLLIMTFCYYILIKIILLIAAMMQKKSGC